MEIPRRHVNDAVLEAMQDRLEEHGVLRVGVFSADHDGLELMYRADSLDEPAAVGGDAARILALYRTAVRKCHEEDYGVPGRLQVTAVGPDYEQHYRWFVDPEWLVANFEGDLSAPALVRRIDATMDGPRPLEFDPREGARRNPPSDGNNH